MANRVIIEGDFKYRHLISPLKSISLKILRYLKIKNSALEIFLVGDKMMKKNVLAFPAVKGFPRPDLKGKKPLGEIYLNPDYIKTRGEDLYFMLIHGVLHLLGYDHKQKSDRMHMERKEYELYSWLRHRISHDKSSRS